MKVLGLDFDNSPHIAKDKSLRYAKNITIDNTGQSYFNEHGFKQCENYNTFLHNIGLDKGRYNIIGTIPTNIGVVLFVVYTDTDVFKSSAILYYNNETKNVTRCYLDKNNYLKFSIDRPIHGDYIYNYKNELIVVFTEGDDDDANETRIFNIDNYQYENEYTYPENTIINITKNDINNILLIPDVIYPKLNTSVNDGGNLKTGAYQIAIKYKCVDGTYTNYSTLTPTEIICSNYEEETQLGVELNKHIKVEFDNISNFQYYKLAIIYIDEESQTCYETQDLKLESTNSYIINDVSSFNIITLEDILIKNVSYCKDTTLVNFNNRLIRGGVQTLKYDSKLEEALKNIANSGVEVYTTHGSDITNYINKVNRYFKEGEVYSLYIGFHDSKGDLINIYHINYNDNDENKGLEKFKIDDLNTAHKIQYKNREYNTYNLNIDENNKYYEYSTENNKLLVPNIIGGTKNNLYHLPKSIISNNQTDLVFGLNDTPIANFNNIIEVNSQNLFDKELETIKYKFETTNSNVDTSFRLYDLTNYFTKYELDDMFCIPRDKNDSNIKLDASNNYYYDLTDIKYSTDLIIRKNETKYILPILIINDIDYNTNNVLWASEYKVLSKSYIPIITTKIKNNIQIPDIVKSISYYFVEHNFNNSRIISQAIGIYDTEINEFGNSQTYSGQFNDKDNHRLYPFELLYNKVDKIQTYIQPLYETSKLTFLTQDYFNNKEEFDSIKVNNEQKETGSTADSKGVAYLDDSIENLIYQIPSIDNPQSELHTLEYKQNNNSSIGNIAGDSYYKVKNISLDTLKDLEEKCYIADIINKSDNLYSSIDNQKLQIASSIISVNECKNPTELIGDTFISYLTLRFTTPSKYYVYGNAQKQYLDSNAYVYRWIVTLPIESKYNILARFGINIVDKPYKYHNKKPSDMLDALRLSFKVDNFINSDVGKSYSPVFNENGIEPYVYFNSIINTTNNYKYRIARSLAHNTESSNLNWRIYKSDDYKDMPFNKGNIISLKTNNQYLYVQQRYGLHILQQRDTLNNDENNNSYLGTSDIFNMEPKEVLFSPTGYIGCENQFDTDLNVTGYYVIDIINKAIYQINGDKPSRISSLNVKTFFDNYLDINAKNTYSNNGRSIVYNEDVNLLYITQNTDKNNFTISYSDLFKCWISLHDYYPIKSIYTRYGLLHFTINALYHIDKTVVGKYFGTNKKESVIQFISNTNSIYNKLLNHIAWIDRVTDINNNLIKHTHYYKTINEIMVHNDDQCTGYKTVKYNNKWYDGSTGVNKINVWRFNNIDDIAKNNNFLIDPITIDKNNLKLNSNWYDINKFISQFIYITMKYNNEDNLRWELMEISPDYMLDNRNTQENTYEDTATDKTNNTKSNKQSQ